MRLKTFSANTNCCTPARTVFFAVAPEKPQPVEQKAENVDQLIEQLKAELSQNETALGQKRAEVLQIFQKFQAENQNGKLKNEAGTFMLKVALKLQNIEGKANYGAYKKMSAADKAKIEGTMQNIRQILEGKNSKGEDLRNGVTTAAKIEADRQTVLADYGEAKSMSAAERFAAQKSVDPIIDQKSAESVQTSRTEQTVQENNVPAATPVVSAAEKVADSVAATIQPSQNEVKPAEKENPPSRSIPTTAAEIPTSSFGPRVQIDSREVAQSAPTAVESKDESKKLTDRQIANAAEALFNNPGRRIATLTDGSILVKGVETDVDEAERGQAEDAAFSDAEGEALIALQGKTSNQTKETTEGTETVVSQHAEGGLRGVQRFQSRFENGKLTVIIRVPPQTIGEEVAARESTKPQSKNSEFSEVDITAEAAELALNADPQVRLVELPNGFLVKGTYQNLSRVRVLDRRNAEMFAIAAAKLEANLYLDKFISEEDIHVTPHGGTFSTAEENLNRELTGVEQMEIPNSFDFETKTATVVLFVPKQSLEKKFEPTTIPEPEDEDY